MFKSKTKHPLKKSEVKCQNCKAKFTIEPEDFEFYKKIDVPEPTFCPECRAQRRYAFWNIIELYKRKCDFSKKDIISMYRPDLPYKVYESKIWWSDKWDSMDYGRDYNFDKPFFQQFKELELEVPRAHNLNINSVNCDYCVCAVNCKNCYLCAGNGSEDCIYSVVGMCKNCVDSYWVIKCENCYENVHSISNYNTHFSQFSEYCIDSFFLQDCRNCQNCFSCNNLRNKKYHIFNKPYSKEEYFKEIKKYDLGSYESLEKIKNQFERFGLGFPRRFARIYKSINVVGDNVASSKNCYYCFNASDSRVGRGTGVEDSKYIYAGGSNLKDSYDVFDGGSNAELLYECVTAGMNLNKVLFSAYIADGVYNTEYSDNCFSSSNLFGCISLRHKKHCILNKQYTKEEYEELVPKIKKHMNKMPYIDKKGRIYKYGEFFPIELSPFDYNKSMAQEHFPLSKKEVLEEGYVWYDKSKLGHQVTIKAKDLPDHIKDIDKAILKEVIECASPNCVGRGAFRIIPSELEFYKKRKFALPRLCPECRISERYKKKNPSRLYHRQCMKKGCNTEFETSYAPDRKEIVYCEECFNKEIIN